MPELSTDPKAPCSAGPGVVIKGGTIVDAAGQRACDIVISRGRIEHVQPGCEVPCGAKVLDASGCIVAPGLVDLHSHLREPGGELAETVESGSRAAALGGYSAVVAMPNTDPPIDNASAAHHVLDLGAHALVEVMVAGAITVDRAGERLAPMAEMASMGISLFTDDGTGVQDGGLMRRAMEYARGLGVTLAQHCEDRSLASGGHMHEGRWSSILGIPGIPAEAEELMVARDLMLARLTGARLHLLHLSTAGSVELVRKAKSAGIKVTAEVTPHHLCLSDEEVASYDPLFKVSPPLRPVEHIIALQAGLEDGTVDAVATDHAPHATQAKEAPFDQAPSGMLGLETALAVVLTELWDGRVGSSPQICGEKTTDIGATRQTTGTAGSSHSPGMAGSRSIGPAGGRHRLVDLGACLPSGIRLNLMQILTLLSWQPASIARLGSAHPSVLRPGAVASICVFDPFTRWVVDPDRLASKSKNTPFAGVELQGQVRHTLVGGEPVVIEGEAQR